MSTDSHQRSDKSSYGEILKSSALIGGSQAIVLALGIVRAKGMALLLGPAGFGLMGLYTSIVEFAASAAGMGVGSSGVRQVAEAGASNDRFSIARTIAALRVLSLLLGVLGALLVCVLALPVSKLTFGDSGHAWAIAAIGLAVLFRIVSSGQTALVQGLRRISDLASMNLFGALLATGATLLLVFFFGEDGIVAAVVAGAFLTFVIAWRYCRRIAPGEFAFDLKQLRPEMRHLLKLGIAFFFSAVMMMGAMYAVRTIVARQIGLDAAGLYHASWTLGGMYVGMLLQAMGADFYPRLTAVSQDHPQCNRLVNEQALVSLLLAGPGVIATLAFAPALMVVFYSNKFIAAAELLQWFCLGMTLRIISWPVGYVIVAKNDRKLFIATELAWTIVNVGLTWFFLQWFGLSGAGIAFFGSYVFHAALVYIVVRRVTGFRWSALNLRIMFIYMVLIALMFAGTLVLAPGYVAVLGLAVCIGMGIHALRSLATLIAPEDVPRRLRGLIERIRIGRTAKRVANLG